MLSDTELPVLQGAYCCPCELTRSVTRHRGLILVDASRMRVRGIISCGPATGGAWPVPRPRGPNGNNCLGARELDSHDLVDNGQLASSGNETSASPGTSLQIITNSMAFIS